MVIGLKDHGLARLGPRGVRLGLKYRLRLRLAGRLGYWAWLGWAGRKQGLGPTALSLSLLSLLQTSLAGPFSLSPLTRGVRMSVEKGSGVAW